MSDLIEITPSESACIIAAKRSIIEDVQVEFSWACYDTWPWWMYFLPASSRALVFKFRDTFLVGKYPDDALGTYGHKYWCVPYNHVDIERCFKDLLAETGEMSFVPKILATHWELKLDASKHNFNDYICRTQHLIDMSGPELSRKRSGVKRYNDQSKFRLVPFEHRDEHRAIELIENWEVDKHQRGSEFVDAMTYKLICSPPPTCWYKGFSFNEQPKGIFVQDIETEHYIAAGIGFRLTDFKWSQIIRLSLTKYQYLSDFVFSKGSECWKDTSLESDGCPFDADENLKAYKAKWADPTLALQMITVTI
jgi:hypothetical protein